LARAVPGCLAYLKKRWVGLIQKPSSGLGEVGGISDSINYSEPAQVIDRSQGACLLLGEVGGIAV